MSSFTVGAVSLVVWVLLWGEVTLGNLVSGIVVAAVLMAVFPNDGPLWPTHFFHPLHTLRFIGYFLKSIVASNLVLSREIVSRHSRIQTGVVVVPMPDCTPAMIRFIANVTALTPGTIAVDVSNEPPELSVHILQLFDVNEARASIDNLRYRSVRAFGDPQARAHCVRLIEVGGRSADPLEPQEAPTPDGGEPS